MFLNRMFDAILEQVGVWRSNYKQRTIPVAPFTEDGCARLCVCVQKISVPRLFVWM